MISSSPYNSDTQPKMPPSGYREGGTAVFLSARQQGKTAVAYCLIMLYVKELLIFMQKVENVVKSFNLLRCS